MWLLTGVLIGAVLGLTGAGGSVFAVPMLVLGAGLAMQDATGIALGVVASSAAVGVLLRAGSGVLALRPALLLTLSGSITVVVGQQLALVIPELWLSLLFLVLALVIALRMWRQAPDQGSEVRHPRANLPPNGGAGDSNGWEWPPLVIAGGVAGMLAGIFGVGGGFFIVPMLVFLTRMAMPVAVGTSLLVILGLSLTGFMSYLLRAPQLNGLLLTWLAAGGAMGMWLGSRTAAHLNGQGLQRAFAVTIGVLSLLSLLKNAL
ncbi:sulfite exporter TauE/SafE family protein [Aestuariirhabdus litorea]|uniref:Probable membrane transporter protein n=1 Tax=Aestuariirhabdus litorea TaxID=2528527 RepID=A0A3P3VPU4_9GAMM|nr:sulfite exporter TauE/SafE family protein [Aestuariirhabdus litorea]RRJ84811.1 sulfite exporter TauE/SafE family protein [Aestuariirhabdus litorea]RWW98036.1 sulfite exporter TauE/SafE family protein [Endozoicomonadaceae bacterium GTF-13]